MEIEEGSYSETSFLDSYYPRWQCDPSLAAFAIVDVRTKVDVRWNCSTVGRGVYFRSWLVFSVGRLRLIYLQEDMS